MKNFQDLINDCLPAIKEIFPWDLQKIIDDNDIPILLDIREPYEFDVLHIKDSINVPRGILETACDYGYEETVPELVKARDREIIIICRSGNRSVLAAYVMQLMGYQSVKSLKTGIKGWNDYELPLQNSHGEIVNIDKADMILMPKIRLEQLPPQKPKITL